MFDVTVVDITPPSIVCPANTTQNADASCDISLLDYTGSATTADNCDASPVVTQSPVAGTIINGAGTVQTVTLSSTDASGNFSTCTFDVTVVDIIAPSIVCPANTTQNADASCDISLLDYTGSATTADNCDAAPVVTQSPVAGTIINGSGTVQTVTLTSADASGNFSTCTFDVTVVDVIAPSIVCPANTTENADVSCDLSLPDYTGSATTSDNCDAAPVVTQSPVAGTNISGVGTVQTVTLISTDASGNFATCTFDVTVVDATPPSITCPTDVVVNNDPGVCSATGVVLGTPATADNCSVASVTDNGLVTYPLGVTNIIWTVTDGSGNTSTCTQTVTVVDNEAPVLPIILDVNVECGVTIPVPTATDNCAGTILGFTTDPLIYTVQGTYVINWTFDDGNGNVVPFAQNVIVDDVTAPVADVTPLADVTDECSIALLMNPTATDNCGGVVTVSNDATLPITAQGITVVTWTYTDVNGNSSTQMQNVVITDVTAPVADVTMLGDINGVCEISILLDPTATDNCSAVTVSNDVVLPISTSSTITWTYTDASGNTSTQTQNAVLIDPIAPTASNPADSSYECIGDAIIDVNVVTDEADNCAAPITVTHVSDVVTGNGCMDTITRTYNVADGSGNNIDVVQMIYIQDVTLPTASNPLDLTVQCIGDVPAPVTGWVSDEADNCSTPVVAFVSDASDGLSCPETITRTFSVTDACGNTIDVVQMVIILDIDAPIVDVAALPEITSLCDVTPSTPTATDNCVGTVDGTSDVTFPITALGTTTITWTYIDACGNTSSQTQDVTIGSIDVTTTMASDLITIVANNNNPGVTHQWIDCDSNTSIAGETNHNYTPTYGGNFAVIVTQDGCSDTSDCVVSVVGIDEMTLDGFVLYPNPTNTGSFTIVYEGELREIIVVDMLGRVIQVEANLETKTVNTSRLERGKYMVLLHTESDTILQQEVVVIR
jgi:hypothetical protein